MNNLFDSMNSKSRYCSKPFACAASNKTDHEKFWRDMCSWVQSWKFVKHDNTVTSLKPCQNGLIITLKAVIGIFNLFKNENIPFLLTNRLNQDCLENTFSSIRRRGGFRDNPDCREFRSTVRYVIVSNFTKKSKSANCEIDDAESFIQINELNVKAKKMNENISSEESNIEKMVNENEQNVDMRNDEDFEIDDAENFLKLTQMNENTAAACFEENDEGINYEISRYSIEENFFETEDVELRKDEDFEEILRKTANNDFEENIIAYIAGFFARAYLRKVSCEECQAILVDKKKNLECRAFLLYFREYKHSEVGGLTWPSDTFFNFMTQVSKLYFECVDKYFRKSNVRKNICSYLRQSITSDLLKDHVHRVEAVEFIILKFVTMMIKHKIKYLNSKLSSDISKKLKHVRHL